MINWDTECTVNIPRREGTAATVGWAVRSDNRQSGVRVVMTDVFPRRRASIGGPAGDVDGVSVVLRGSLLSVVAAQCTGGTTGPAI